MTRKKKIVITILCLELCAFALAGAIFSIAKSVKGNFPMLPIGIGDIATVATDEKKLQHAIKMQEAMLLVMQYEKKSDYPNLSNAMKDVVNECQLAFGEESQPTGYFLLEQARFELMYSHRTEAVVPARKAVKLYEKNNDPAELFKSRQLLARILRQGDRQEITEAKYIFIANLALAQKIDKTNGDTNDTEQQDALEELARFYGENQKYQESIDVLKREISLLKKLPKKEVQISNILGQIGSCEEADGQLNKAINYYKQALTENPRALYLNLSLADAYRKKAVYSVSAAI